eukprot:gene9236-11316_t
MGRKIGSKGSLRGGSPFGYFSEHGIGTLCYFANGSIVKDGTIIYKGESYSSNDSIGMFIDTSTNSIAYFKNQKLQGNLCPICGVSLKLVGKDWADVNKHIDECLTLSLLDNEHGTKPFNVTCPYPKCKNNSILSKDFVSHCMDSHYLEGDHNHKCPLCKVDCNNLISHLSKTHISLPSIKKQSFVGVGYSTSVLEQDLGELECAVCLEEFYRGQTVARLECWCLFHIDCITSYITKTNKCPVHS